MVNQDNISELANDPNPENRRYAAYVFRYFKDFPDKDEVWDDLHRLTQDDNSIVRQNAARAFVSFSAFPDKVKAWDALHRLTQDRNRTVRQNVVFCLNRVYENSTEKEEILVLLNELIGDSSNRVQAAAYYSLARIYVYESSKTDDKQLFDKNYEKAMQFFEKAYASSPWISINFCFTIHTLFH